MYLSILILPLIGSIVSGFMGRKVGVTGAHLITCTCLILSSILMTLAFYEVGICGSPVSIYLANWVDSEIMFISWEFYFDQLTVSLGLAVLYCSTLIHIYSVSYMSEDPHPQRFMSYLSLFTFFMLFLVSAGNYFTMFVGWEGEFNCLKWFNSDPIFYNYNISFCVFVTKNISGPKMNLLKAPNYIRFFSDNNNKLTSDQRIGPHNLDIISIIIGSILGDSHLEKRKRGIGTRIIFEQSNKNVEYLMWFHSYFSIRGYCKSQKPKLNKRIRKNGKVSFNYRINTYTFSSFNWIHEMFYNFIELENRFVKIIPYDIEKYLTPLTLAI
jgi:hypothetical protein